jgi:hypothetical protein
MPVKKVIKRVGTILREVRDLPTAQGTSMVASDEYRAKSPSTEAKLKQNINMASKNLDRQLSEVAAAVLRGERGTSSAEIGKFGEYKKGKPRK